MGRGPVRWIAIALVGALIAALAVSLVSGGGGAGGDATGAPGTSDRPVTAASEVLDGPHLWLDLCAGVVCPPVTEQQQEALVADLDADPRVAATLLVSSEEVYELFLARYGDDEELVASVRPEDVPARIEVDLLDPTEVEAVMAEYADHEGVATANDARSVQP